MNRQDIINRIVTRKLQASNAKNLRPICICFAGPAKSPNAAGAKR